jgi:Flp pilus assembly protein TadD
MESQAAAHHRSLSAMTLQRYAFALATVGRTNDATKEMEAASGAEPRNAALHNDLGSLYALQQQWPQAEAEFAVASHLMPLNAQIHWRLGWNARLILTPEMRQSLRSMVRRWLRRATMGKR